MPREKKLPIEGRSEKERGGLSFVTLILKVFIPETKTDTQDKGLSGKLKLVWQQKLAKIKRLD